MTNTSESIYKNVKTYLSLVEDVYKRKEHKKITFQKGYYWSEVEDLRKLEQFFLEINKEDASMIAKLLQNEKSPKKTALLLHVLGWSSDYKKASNILTGFFTHKDTVVSNAAARALFPMVAAAKVPLPANATFNLLKRRNKYLKNKALGLLAFSTEDDIAKIKPLISFNYLKKLSKSNEGVVSSVANLVIKKIYSTQYDA